MPRAFLCWLAFLVAASWSGITLLERDTFSATVALSVGAVAALATGIAVRRRPVPDWVRGAGWLPLVALALSCTLVPTVDTTLVSQDASIHLASGRWLARTGSLAIPDPSLEGVPDEIRFALFDLAGLGMRQLSFSRLPGGLVVPGHLESFAYPSFAHLLAVWIAIADRAGGLPAIGLLGPLFAVTAWWAIALVALAQAGRLAAVAALLLLATWLPEHWFARFLMPEIPTQALVWSGVAASLLCGDDRSRAGRRAASPDGAAGSGAGPAAGVLCGAALGVAGFARLEQLAIFVPALLLARAALPASRRVLPVGGVPVFALAALHATAHLVIVPTDYGKRISRTLLEALVTVWGGLGGTPLRVASGLLVLAGLAATGAWLLQRRRPGSALRVAAGIAGGALAAAILAREVPDQFPAVDWLRWYVPWPVWIAAAFGVVPLAAPSGLGLALFLEAADQVFNPRVGLDQIWGARRLVTVVLPLLALAAAWSIGRRDSPRSAGRRRAGFGLVAVGIVAGAFALQPVLWRRLQTGGDRLVTDIARALPPDATLVIGSSLDWLHLAPVLWLEHDRVTIVARNQWWEFMPALGWYAANRAPGEVYFLSGAMAGSGDEIDPDALLPDLPAGIVADRVGSFRWDTRTLERTMDRPAAARVEQRAEIGLYRLRPESPDRAPSACEPPPVSPEGPRRWCMEPPPRLSAAGR